jgi:hypothetical protein
MASNWLDIYRYTTITFCKKHSHTNVLDLLVMNIELLDGILISLKPYDHLKLPHRLLTLFTMFTPNHGNLTNDTYDI